jgi:predicted MFS family arabinose efflux permease
MLFALALGSLALFTWQEQRAIEPIIPLSLFRNTTVALSCAIMFIAFTQIIALSVLIPLRLQMLTDLGADGAALQLVPMSLGIPFGSFIGGRLASRTGRYKRLQQTGAGLVPFLILALALTSPHATVLNLIWMGLAGFTLGLQLPTSLVAVQNAVEYRHIGVATAVAAFCRSLGAAVGIALLMALLLATLQSHAPESLTSLSGGQIINAMVGDTLIRLEAVVLSELAGTVESAFSYVFIASAAIAALAFALSLFIADEALSDEAPSLA